MGQRRDIPIGIIYSQAGAYEAIGRTALAGARMAIDEINADDSLAFRFVPHVRDPEGQLDLYARAAQELVRGEGCSHLIGTITSSSRKEVLPVVERAGALLWYAFPYEGYETSDNVLYLGATANQHIVPMFDYVLPRFGLQPYLIGSNYIWGWEINRIAREIVAAAGSEPVGESYLPLGDTDVDHLIAAVEERRPDFVLSNLIGPSSYAFIRAYAELGRRNPDFAPDVRPIVSCNLTEADIDAIGPDAAGVLSTAVYFNGVEEGTTDSFQAETSQYCRRPSQCFVGPYTAVHILARAIALADGAAEPDEVRRLATQTVFKSLYGPICIDPKTGHSHLRPYFGRVGADGGITVLHRAETPIAPDPYLVRHASERAAGPAKPAQPFHLKVVR
ncbi:transporter substrate-binding protein [Oryzibacter oryziterrae]|uniref:transporter substrate-binding protein n=1 Tax=Oryzibacter oryziterrae TaxID=2766474 RepID=UPI001F43940B|nr:transporter substrate-binding protein [Oryzibacter oryziterrae]